MASPALSAPLHRRRCSLLNCTLAFSHTGWCISTRRPMSLGLLAFAPPIGRCRDGCLAQPLDRARLLVRSLPVQRDPSSRRQKAVHLLFNAMGVKGLHTGMRITRSLRQSAEEHGARQSYLGLQYAAPSLDLALRKPHDSSKANMRGFEASRDAGRVVELLCLSSALVTCSGRCSHPYHSFLAQLALLDSFLYCAALCRKRGTGGPCD